MTGLESENNGLEIGNLQPGAPLSFLTALSSLLKESGKAALMVI